MSELYDIQRQIIQDAEDQRSYFEELNSWREAGVKAEESRKSTPSTSLAVADKLPPVRGSKEEADSRRQNAADTARAAALQNEKDQGNKCSKDNNFTAAIDHYTKGLMYDAKNVALLSNRSFAYLKLSQWREAADDAMRAIACSASPGKVSEENFKAFYRRSVARRNLEDLEGALSDLNALAAYRPQDATVAADLTAVREEYKNQRLSHRKRLTIIEESDDDDDDGHEDGQKQNQKQDGPGEIDDAASPATSVEASVSATTPAPGAASSPSAGTAAAASSASGASLAAAAASGASLAAAAAASGASLAAAAASSSGASLAAAAAGLSPLSPSEGDHTPMGLGALEKRGGLKVDSVSVSATTPAPAAAATGASTTAAATATAATHDTVPHPDVITSELTGSGGGAGGASGGASGAPVCGASSVAGASVDCCTPGGMSAANKSTSLPPMGSAGGGAGGASGATAAAAAATSPAAAAAAAGGGKGVHHSLEELILSAPRTFVDVERLVVNVDAVMQRAAAASSSSSSSTAAAAGGGGGGASSSSTAPSHVETLGAGARSTELVLLLDPLKNEAMQSVFKQSWTIPTIMAVAACVKVAMAENSAQVSASGGASGAASGAADVAKASFRVMAGLSSAKNFTELGMMLSAPRRDALSGTLDAVAKALIVHAPTLSEKFPALRRKWGPVLA